MKVGNIKFLLFALFCGFYVFVASAATSLFSDYGQIQNVQNYSSNPFWSPGAPYNQRMPQPVYVQGADLNAGDCFQMVQSLISVQCMARDNCQNTTLNEIRPAVMVALSGLPNNNYVSACSGYIDSVFESYVKQYSNSVPGHVAFPTPTQPNQNMNNGNNNIQIKNPYKQEIPEWQQQIKERSNELQILQQQNSADNNLSAANFPETYADLSFTTRMNNAMAGYEPYKDSKAYIVPDFFSCNDPAHANDEACKKKEENTEEKPTENTTNGNNKQNTEKTKRFVI